MLLWARIKSALGYGFTFVLIVCTFIAVQSQSVEEEPSAEGRLSQYYGPQAAAMLYPGEDGLPYPGEYGDFEPLYPGDEQWDGISRVYYRYPTDIQSMSTDGQTIYAGGGYLPVYPYEPEMPLAMWEDNQWKQVAEGADGVLQGKVYAVATQGQNLYAGGNLSQAGSIPVNNIARWNGSQWNAMAGGVTKDTGEADVAVIAVDGTNVYVGGWFDRAGGQPAKNIARWDGSAWHPLGSGVDSDVKAIVVMNNMVYVGGDFNTAGGVTVNHVARWDGASWSALNSGLSGMVNALAVKDNTLYAGGEFYRTGINWNGTAVNNIARWDGNAWQPLDSGLPGTVHTMKAVPDGIYAAGRFQKITGDYSAFSIAFWDGSSWSNLGSGIHYTSPFYYDRYAYGMVNDLLPYENRLYAGGIFSYAGNNWSDGFAWWNEDPEAVLLGTGAAPVAPGSTIYIYGKYFQAFEEIELSVNGEILARDLRADKDGKVYIRLLTLPENAPGDYPFTLSSPTHTVNGLVTLDPGAPKFSSDFTGWDLTYPPYSVHLPVVTR